jgi:hypothetical protein
MNDTSNRTTDGSLPPPPSSLAETGEVYDPNDVPEFEPPRNSETISTLDISEDIKLSPTCLAELFSMNC